MKRIIKIKTNEKDFPIEEMWSSYIFSYLFLFLIKNNLYNDESKMIKIDNDLLDDLNRAISFSLNDILEASYKEPSISELQKHSTRFEKILLNGKLYKVNYRMSVYGRLAFAIYCLMNFINDAKTNNMDVYIEYVQ